MGERLNQAPSQVYYDNASNSYYTLGNRGINSFSSPNEYIDYIKGGSRNYINTGYNNNVFSNANLQPLGPSENYWGQYTAPMNINPTIQSPLVTTDKNGRVVQTKSKTTSSFDNPSPLPNYSMYLAPSQMPNINSYLSSPNSLLGAMQSSGIPLAGAGRFSNLTNTGKSNV